MSIGKKCSKRNKQAVQVLFFYKLFLTLPVEDWLDVIHYTASATATPHQLNTPLNSYTKHVKTSTATSRITDLF